MARVYSKDGQYYTDTETGLVGKVGGSGAYGGGLNANAGSNYGIDPLVQQDGTGKIMDAPYGYEGPTPYRKPAKKNTQTTQGPSIEDYIRQIQEANRQKAIAGLDNYLNTATSNLNAEEAKIDPYYYNAKNKAAAASDIGKLNFGQFAASRGIQGNAGALPEIYRNVGLQNTVGALEADQAAAKADIARRRTDVQNAYESDLASAEAGITADTLSALINQMNADRTFRYQQERDATADTRYNTEQERKNYADTIDRFYDNYQAEINNVANDNDPNNDWQISLLQAARQQKIAQIEAEQAAARAKADELQTEEEKQVWDRAIDLWKASGVANAEIASILGVREGARTADYNLDLIRANSSGSNNNPTAPEPVDYGSYIETMFVRDGEVDVEGLINYLDNLSKNGVPESVIRDYATRYGLVIPETPNYIDGTYYPIGR